MQYRKLGSSNLFCSTVAIGTWGIGGDFWGEVDDDTSIRTIRAALDMGVNIIDTAPIYGNGRSEEVVGRAIKGYDRSKIIIATKVGVSLGPDKKHISDRPSVLAEADASLRRLQVDCIDLYQVHWPDPITPLEETFTTLRSLLDAGKARYIGVSNFSIQQMEEARKYCPIVSAQPQYSLLQREIEQDLLPYCREHSLGVLTYGSIGAGALTGKFKERPVVSDTDKRARFYKHFSEENWPRAAALAAALSEIAEARGVPTVQVAINWVLKQPGITVALVGAKNPQQAVMNTEAGSWSLTDEENRLIEAAYGRIMGKKETP